MGWLGVPQGELSVSNNILGLVRVLQKSVESFGQRENVLKTWARLLCDSKSFHAKRTFELIKHIYLWLENPKRKLTQFLRGVQHEHKFI